MPLIHYKVELKLKWTKYCVLSAAGGDNADANPNILFTIKDTKLYIPVLTLSARDNQISKLLSKGFKRSVYWSKYKQKMRIKVQQMNIDIFSNQIFFELIDCLF